MKKIFLILINFLLVCSCVSNKQVDSTVLVNILETNNFTFIAQRAFPTNNDVVNLLNTFPSASATNIMNLDYGYSITVKDQKLTVNLPFFGRVYNPSPDPAKAGFNFESKDFTLKKEQNKKGSWYYIITPKDVFYIKTLYVEIFKNGKSFVSINSSDRQAISYDGYVKDN